MGLRDIVGQAVGAAFSAVGDLAATATYNAVTEQGEYDPVTGTSANTVNPKTVKLMLSRYNQWELKQQPVLPGDWKATAQMVELGAAPLAKLDTVTINGDDWLVVAWTKDPTDSLVTMQLRMV